jgi:hypothetical protein
MGFKDIYDYSLDEWVVMCSKCSDTMSYETYTYKHNCKSN